jgi:hypothetical protein
VVYPRKMLPMFVFQAFSCQIWAKYLMGDAAMVANLDITRFCRLLVLVTNWALKKDLEVSVPSNLIFFSAHVFLDMSQETFINNIIGFPGQNWVWGQCWDGAQSRWSDVVVLLLL